MSLALACRGVRRAVVVGAHPAAVEPAVMALLGAGVEALPYAAGYGDRVAPQEGEVRECAELASRVRADAVVVVGGGAEVDLAKGVAVLAGGGFADGEGLVPGADALRVVAAPAVPTLAAYTTAALVLDPDLGTLVDMWSPAANGAALPVVELAEPLAAVPLTAAHAAAAAGGALAALADALLAHPANLAVLRGDAAVADGLAAAAAALNDPAGPGAAASVAAALRAGGIAAALPARTAPLVRTVIGGAAGALLAEPDDGEGDAAAAVPDRRPFSLVATALLPAALGAAAARGAPADHAALSWLAAGVLGVPQASPEALAAFVRERTGAVCFGGGGGGGGGATFEAAAEEAWTKGLNNAASVPGPRWVDSADAVAAMLRNSAL